MEARGVAGIAQAGPTWPSVCSNLTIASCEITDSRKVTCLGLAQTRYVLGDLDFLNPLTPKALVLQACAPMPGFMWSQDQTEGYVHSRLALNQHLLPLATCVPVCGAGASGSDPGPCPW